MLNDHDFIDLTGWEDEAPDVTISFPNGKLGYRTRHIKTDMETNEPLSVLIPPSATSTVTPTGRVVDYITGVELTNVIHSEDEKYYKLYGYSQMLEINSAKRLLTPGEYRAIPLFAKILGNANAVHGLAEVYYIVPLNGEDDSLTYYNQLRTGCPNKYSLLELERSYPYPKREVDIYHVNNMNPDKELKELFTSMIFYCCECNGGNLDDYDIDGLYQRFLSDKHYRNSLQPYLPSIEYSTAVKLVVNYLKYGTIAEVGGQLVFGSQLVWRMYSVDVDIDQRNDVLAIVRRLANDIDALNQYMVYAYSLDRPIDEIIV